ncbi:MAG: class I SAM-dependent methyltransferase, partial [Gaiella sp.]
GAVAVLVLLVHALSQAPQNEFALPVAPVWIVAALVGLLAPATRQSLTAAARSAAPPSGKPGLPHTRIDVVRAVVGAVGGGPYLELGVKDGACFQAIDARTKVAVDPAFAFRVPVRAWLRTHLLRARTGSLYFRTTSDAFFRRAGRRLQPFAVVFVDGLHTAEQSQRDVLNALAVLEPGGAVVVHGCNPESPAAAAPTLAEAQRTPGYRHVWNGDVYRTIVRLRTRPDLRVVVIDLDQGVGIVTPGRNDDPLPLSEVAVDALTYEDLRRDRQLLLGLRPPIDLDEILADLVTRSEAARRVERDAD